MAKDRLTGTLSLCFIDPQELDGLDEWVEYLDALINGPCLILEESNDLILVPDPLIIRVRIALVRNMKIEIRSNEHAPPHFHVISPEIDASFTIDNCEILQGKISTKDYKKIKYWHQSAKPMLIETWNSVRPTDCVVGLYRDTNEKQN
jgi:hypothetical protein